MRSSGLRPARSCDDAQEQREEGSLAVVERVVVVVVRTARGSREARAAHGVDVAAAERRLRDPGGGRERLDRTGDPQRAVQVAGERHAQADDIGLVQEGEVARELVEHGVDQRRRAGERGGQRIEADRARREALAVARELEVGRDALADDVREVHRCRGWSRCFARSATPSAPNAHCSCAPSCSSSASKRGPSGQQLATGDAQRPRVRILAACGKHADHIDRVEVEVSVGEVPRRTARRIDLRGERIPRTPRDRRG